MTRLTHSVEQHLLQDQADAVAVSAQDFTPPTATGNVRDGDESSAALHSDPTSRAALSRQYAKTAAHARQLDRALTGVARALNDAEATCTRILAATTTEPVQDDEQRCPGWTAELRARLGGCGKVLERWKDARGEEHVRSTYLCVGCRKASERAERAAEQEAA